MTAETGGAMSPHSEEEEKRVKEIIDQVNKIKASSESAAVKIEEMLPILAELEKIALDKRGDGEDIWDTYEGRLYASALDLLHTLMKK